MGLDFLISPYPEKEILTQAILDDLASLIRINSTPNAISIGNVTMESVLASLCNGNYDSVYLASVSKIALVYAYAKVLDLNNIKEIPVNFDSILELIGKSGEVGRGPDRIFYRGELLPAYHEAFLVLKSSITVTPTLNVAKFGKSLSLKLDSAINGEILTAADIEFLLTCLRSKEIKSLSKTLIFNLPVEEFKYLTLVLSSNSPLKSLNNYLTKLELSSNIDAILKEDIKNFSRTLSSESNAHWAQEDANIGSIEEFSNLILKIYNNALNEDQFSINFLEQLSQGIDFGHDFTNSKLGKLLKSKGWKIYEKTGYQDAICWVKALAEQGKPIHSSLSTAILLVPPAKLKKEPITISFEQSYELEYPTENMLEDGLIFP
jgi:hypothetical protein